MNVYSDVFDPSTAAAYEELARLAEKGAWGQVLALLEERQVGEAG